MDFATAQNVKNLIDEEDNSRSKTTEGFLPIWRAVDRVGHLTGKQRTEAILKAIELLDEYQKGDFKSVLAQWNWSNALWTLLNHARSKGDRLDEIKMVTDFVNQSFDKNAPPEIQKWLKELLDLKRPPGRLLIEQELKDGEWINKEVK